MSRRGLFVVVAALLVLGGWYWFRPERAFLDRRVSEAFTAAPEAATAAIPVSAGSFHGNAHETSGTATIYRLSDGSHVLRLTGFATSNGPDVVVYLVAAPDVTDNRTVGEAGFINLGELKGNIGDQNYQIPAGVDLNRYRSVTIWCRRFSVNFGTAPLALN